MNDGLVVLANDIDAKFLEEVLYACDAILKHSIDLRQCHCF